MTELVDPGAVETHGCDIDDQGRIVGDHLDGSGSCGRFHAEAVR